MYTEHFHSPYGADLYGKADRQNILITNGNHRYRWNVCGLTSGSSFIEENDIAIGLSSSFICISSTSMFILTSLPSPEECTFVKLCKPCSTLSASLQLCKTNIFLSVMCAPWRMENFHPHFVTSRWLSFEGHGDVWTETPQFLIKDLSGFWRDTCLLVV